MHFQRDRLSWQSRNKCLRPGFRHCRRDRTSLKGEPWQPWTTWRLEPYKRFRTWWVGKLVAKSSIVIFLRSGYEIPSENQGGGPPWKQFRFLRNFQTLIWEWPKLVRPDFLPWLVSEPSASSQVISSYFFFWRIPRILRRFFASQLWLF